MLPPVLITATRFTEDANKLPFGVSVLTAADLEKAGVMTVNEALMKLLGVNGRLDLSGGGDYALDLRGFGGTADSNQAVIVDGVRISEGDMSGTRLAGIPINSVERIEVIHGSSAVLYGEGATGGAIVITTKAGDAQQRRSDAQGYFALGSQALADARASLALAGGGFSLDVSGNKRSSDGHRDNFRSSEEGLSSTLQWRNEWLRVGVRHLEDELHSGLPGALTAAQYDANPRQTTHPSDHGDLDQRSDGLFAHLTLGDWQLAFDAGQRNKTSIGDFTSFVYAYDIEARNQSARARHSASFGGMRNTVVMGLDHNEWDRVVRGGDTSEQTSNAVYLKDEFVLPFGTLLSGGLRQERARKTSTSAIALPLDERQRAWEFGVVQPLAAGTSVYAKLGRSFRFANADEISFPEAGGLRPQTSRDLDLGARWVHGGGHAELRFYRNALTDEIGYDPSGNGPFGPFGANVNLDPTRRRGVELEVVQAVNRSVQMRLNAAARQAVFTSGEHAGNSVALVPKRTISVAADWDVGAGHTLTGGVNTVSSQHPDFDNACTMPSYTTADLRYAYRNGPVELALGVANATDKKYYTQAFSCAGGVPTSIYPEAGRSFKASVLVNF